MKTITFTLKTECDKCGDMLPVNGPVKHVTCGSCQTGYDLTPGVWAGQIVSASEGMRTLNNPYTCNDTSDPDPQCRMCEKHFPFDAALIGQDVTINCPHCGHSVATYPPPDWLKKELPAVSQVIGGDREEADGKPGVDLEQKEETSRPVVLSCPNCGGGLKVTSDSQRLIPCEHCNSDVYLPDGVWRRLHPVDMVAPWTLVYDGVALETGEDINTRNAREQARRLSADRDRLSADREKHNLEDEQVRMGQRKSNKAIVTIIVIASIVTFIGFMILVTYNM